MTETTQASDLVPHGVKEVQTRNSERAFYLALGLYLLFLSGGLLALIVVHMGTNHEIAHWVWACIFLPAIPSAGIGVLTYTRMNWKYFHYVPPSY